MFKFTLTITTSVVLLMSGAANLFAMDLEDDTKALTIHHMPKDIIKEIFTETSKDVTPRRLVSVCKYWYNIVTEGRTPENVALPYPTMNPFMKNCMNTYWDHQFYNGILRYTPINGGQSVTLKFADLNEEGTFDLSACDDTSQYLVITTSPERFFEVEGENGGKTVILFTPRHIVEQGINTLTHPFADLMADWDADKAPVGMFWRWGHDKNLTWVDRLTTASMRMISSCNLFENWQKALISARPNGLTIPQFAGVWAATCGTRTSF